jgi:hypothetical protein
LQCPDPNGRSRDCQQLRDLAKTGITTLYLPPVITGDIAVAYQQEHDWLQLRDQDRTLSADHWPGLRDLRWTRCDGSTTVATWRLQIAPASQGELTPMPRGSISMGNSSTGITTPGVYTFGATELTVISTSGNADDVFIIQIAWEPDSAAGKRVALLGLIQAKNIFWSRAGRGERRCLWGVGAQLRPPYVCTGSCQRPVLTRSIEHAASGVLRSIRRSDRLRYC